jgi:HAD superfamily hydrolase (TIGR01549 family)
MQTERRGVILDVDGTLIDSNDAHARAYVAALAAEHLAVPFERVRPLIGMGAEKLLPAVGVDPRSPTAQRVGQRKKAHFATEYLPRLRACRGGRALLEVMKKRGVRRLVATSAAANELHDLLHAAHLEDLVESESTSSDAEASKPDPEIVVAAIERSGLSRDQLVMLGDTPYDIEAAARADIPTTALRSGGWTDRELAGAVAIYEDPADRLDNLATSLFGWS